MAAERIKFLGLFLDIVKPEEIDEVIFDLASEKSRRPKQIMLVTLWDILKAKRNKEFRAMLESASLVIPTSKSLISGAAFLKKQLPVRYDSFSFIVSVMGVLEKYLKSFYILGGKNKSLQRAEKNIRDTFPKLQLLGRIPGYYASDMEQNIKTAIVKSEPSLVLIGPGVPGNQTWIFKNRNELCGSIFLWDASIIDIFAEQKKRISPALFNAGLEYLPEILKNPLRVFMVFKYLWYMILLLVYRIKEKNTES